MYTMDFDSFHEQYQWCQEEMGPRSTCGCLFRELTSDDGIGVWDVSSAGWFFRRYADALKFALRWA
jgi:hypothetical protein